MPKIQLRQDISKNWCTHNPVLLRGEIGVETDTNKFKIGDGETEWNSLAYMLPTKTSELTNDSGYINISAVPTLTSQLTNDSGFLTQHQDISGKQDKLTAGSNITIDANNIISSTSVSSGNYLDFDNKPQINGVTLSGNKTSAELGIVTNADIPSKTSDLTNDSGYINISSVPTLISELANDSGYVTQSDIPSIGNGTITINQGGVIKGSFSLNQSGNTTINLDSGGNGGLTVDQTHDPTSTNAQSGTAVAEAVSSKQNKLIAGTNLEIVSSSGQLPSGYTELDYIQSTGTQYIDTGFTIPDLTNKYVVHLKMTVDGGTGQGTSSNNWGYMGQNSVFMLNYTRDYGLGTSSAGVPVIADKIYDVTHIRNTNASRELIVDNNNFAMTNQATVYNDRPYGIFALSPFATAFNRIWGKIYEFQAYTNDVLVKNLVPCKRNSDNAIGMYDTVNDEFIPNAGTETFIAGNVVGDSETINFVNNSGYVTNSTLITALANYQPLLETGTNIKTINNVSLLGSGNIDTSEIFIAEFGTTTYNEISNAITANKTIVCHKSESWGEVYAPLDFELTATSYTFSSYLGTNFYQLSIDNNDIWSSNNTAYVDKSGDTMTGDLGLEKSTPVIRLRNTDITTGDFSSNISNDYLVLSGNTDNFSGIAYKRETSGLQYTHIWTRRDSADDWSASIRLGYRPNNNTPYCTFPNTTCCDGQWVYSTENIVPSDTSLNGSTPLTYTLANVPNDGYEYEVLLTCWAVTGSASGNYVAVRVYSDKITTDTYVCRATTRTSSTATCAGNIILPLSTNRKMYVVRETGINGTFQCRLRGYRRIGTNA